MLARFKHVQSSASATWTITHNLGKKPINDVVLNVNGAQTVINPTSVIHTDDNTLVITFSSAQTGEANLI
jgi:hypothetical protein